jgi:hypothetical protein
VIPPVLLLVFNRPDSTAAVIEALRKVRPDRVYVAADGPRAGVAADVDRCAAARAAATAIDWPCDVHTQFRDENLGGHRAIVEAIGWFFEHEPDGIILEDDCLPDPTFFEYCREVLDRYRDDERVMSISGSHFHGDRHRPDTSYFFSRYPHTWGWATWRRSWQRYDASMTRWRELRNTSWLRDIGDGDAAFERYWRKIFDNVAGGSRDIWDYQWIFSCWAAGALSVVPTRNLVKNIGFTTAATHTTATRFTADLPVEATELPLVHPAEVSRDIEADHWTDRHVFMTRRPILRLLSSALASGLRFVPGGSRLADAARRRFFHVVAR